MRQQTMTPTEVRAHGRRSKLEVALERQIADAGLPTPEREYRFAPPRRFRADFCWPEYRLIVECEGGVWLIGRHQRPAGFKSDLEKYNLAAGTGYTVLRFDAEQIHDGTAIRLIRAALERSR